MNALLNQPVQESESGARIRRDKAGRILPGTGGRPKGVANKTTRTLKECVLLAAAQAGDEMVPNGGLQAYLHNLAVNHVQLFTPLLGKAMPLDVTSSDGTMRPVVALYMPDNRRDAKLVADTRPVIEHEPTPALAVPAPAHQSHE